MAGSGWATQYPTHKDTIAQLPLQVDGETTADADYANSVQQILLGLEDKVGSDDVDAGSLLARVGSLETDVGTAQGDITTLQGDVGAAQGDITTLQGDVVALQGSVAPLVTSGVDNFSDSAIDPAQWDQTIPAGCSLTETTALRFYVAGTASAAMIAAKAAVPFGQYDIRAHVNLVTVNNNTRFGIGVHDGTNVVRVEFVRNGANYEIWVSETGSQATFGSPGAATRLWLRWVYTLQGAYAFYSTNLLTNPPAETDWVFALYKAYTVMPKLLKLRCSLENWSSAAATVDLNNLTWSKI